MMINIYDFTFVSGRDEVIKFMTEEGITLPYTKVRTKLFNEQKKQQMRARKMLFPKE